MLLCSYLGPHEAFWHLCGWPLFNCEKTVIRLPIHLPGQQTVLFNADDQAVDLTGIDTFDPDDAAPDPRHVPRGGVAADVHDDGSTMRTHFFGMVAEERQARLENRVEAPKWAPDRTAENISYADFPLFYTFQKGKGWKRRTLRTFGRIVARIHMLPVQMTEALYLRVLLHKLVGKASFEEFKDVPDLSSSTGSRRCVSYHLACVARGYAVDDAQWSETMTEGVKFTRSAKQLRNLFCNIFVYGNPADPVQLFDQFVDPMADDFAMVRLGYPSSSAEILITDEDRYCAFLWIFLKLRDSYSVPAELMVSLTSRLARFDPDVIKRAEERTDSPHPDNVADTVVRPSDADMNHRISCLNQRQKEFYDAVIDQSTGIFFLSAPAGCGKTFLMSLINDVLKYRYQKKTVSTAYSGIAASLLPDGRTFHRYTCVLSKAIYVNNT